MPSRRYKHNSFNLEGNVLFFSDSHFFHHNILKYDDRVEFMTKEDLEIYHEYKRTGNRGPRLSDASIENMNETILNNINSKIKDPDKDIVIIGGDFVFGNSVNQYRRHAEYCRNRINCKDTRIFFGNHDEKDEIYDLFSYCYEQTLLRINGKPVFLNHYPMWVYDGPRYTIMLHGHVHGLYEDKHHPHPFASPEFWLAKDIGIMTNDYFPYTLPQIEEILKPIKQKQEQLYLQHQEHLLF